MMKSTTNCNYCSAEFIQKNPTHKYCCNSCRVQAHNDTKNALINEPINAPFNAFKTQNNNEVITNYHNAEKQAEIILERIIKERQDVFEAKLKNMEIEHERKILELRLSELEKKVRDLEKDSDSPGVSELLGGAIQGYMTYQANKPSEPK